MNPITLTRIEAEKNMRRFYRLDVQPTLFGEYALVREWGRIGRGGRMQSTPYPAEHQARAALDALMARKMRRSYTIAP